MENFEFKDKLVSINRITKVVKGGRRFTFSALIVVGNFAGSIGVGYAKAKQVPDAIKKATQTAKNNLFKIPLKEGRTLHHDVLSKDGDVIPLDIFFLYFQCSSNIRPSSVMFPFSTISRILYPDSFI